MIVGLASVSIDPESGTQLGGYPGDPRPCVGTHDTLMVTVAYIANSDGSGLLLVAFDGLAVSPVLVDAARSAAPAGAAVVVSASHTHSAPATTVPDWDQDVIGHADPGYEAALAAAVGTAAARAVQTAADGVVKVGQARIAENVGSNRRHPGGKGDSLVRVLEFTSSSSEQPLLVVVHGCHPTVLGHSNRLASADLGLGLRIRLAELGYPGHAQLLLGGAGDQSTRHTRHGATFEEAERLGSVLGDAALKAVQTATVVGDIEAIIGRVALPVRELPSPSDADGAVRAAAAALDRLVAANAPDSEIRTAEVDLLGRSHDARRSAAWTDGIPAPPLELIAVRFGHQCVLFAPVEPFLQVAEELEAESGTWLVGYTNGYRGYFMHDHEIAFGGYELGASPFAPGAHHEFSLEARRLHEALR